MAGHTKSLVVMTLTAIGGLALGIQPVRVHIIQVMNPAESVIAPMATETKILSRMALTTPRPVGGRPLAMLVRPLLRMNFGQGHTTAVAKRAIIGNPKTVMTSKANPHPGQYLRIISRLFLDSRMAYIAFGFIFNVQFVIKYQLPRTFQKAARLIGISMACPALLVVFDIMAIAAIVHPRQVYILRPVADRRRFMTCPAFQLIVLNMQLMRKFYISLIDFDRR